MADLGMYKPVIKIFSAYSNNQMEVLINSYIDSLIAKGCDGDLIFVEKFETIPYRHEAVDEKLFVVIKHYERVETNE